jgi:putative FmdB family regulatory protein
MPIYEYRRPDGSTFELVQSFSDESLTHDPETGVAVQRVLHPPAVHFKGKGFYNTDYGTRKRQRESAAASSEGSSADGGGELSSSGEKGASKDGDSKAAAPGKSTESKSESKSKTEKSSPAKKSEPVAAKS